MNLALSNLLLSGDGDCVSDWKACVLAHLRCVVGPLPMGRCPPLGDAWGCDCPSSCTQCACRDSRPVLVLRDGFNLVSVRVHPRGLSGFASVSPSFFFFLIKFVFFNIYLFLRQRERQSMNRGGAEREREAQNRKQSPGSEPSSQSPMRGSNSRTARSRDRDLS